MSLSSWRGDFRKPKKISHGGDQYEARVRLSEEELFVLRAYGGGFSLLELSGAYMCNKSTVLRLLRELSKRVAESAYPLPADVVQKGELDIHEWYAIYYRCHGFRCDRN